MKRKGPKLEAFVSVDPAGATPILCATKSAAEYQNRRTLGANGYTVRLVPADPRRDAVVRAAEAHATWLSRDAEGLTLSPSDKRILAAVEKLRRGK